MTAHPTINAALAARNMLPLDDWCYCPHCDDGQLAREDMATNTRFPGPICWTCYDGFIRCDECNEWTRREYADGTVCLDCSPEHAADQEAEHKCDMIREGL